MESEEKLPLMLLGGVNINIPYSQKLKTTQSVWEETQGTSAQSVP